MACWCRRLGRGVPAGDPPGCGSLGLPACRRAAAKLRERRRPLCRCPSEVLPCCSGSRPADALSPPASFRPLPRQLSLLLVLGLGWLAACNHAQPLPDDLGRAQPAERAQNPRAGPGRIRRHRGAVPQQPTQRVERSLWHGSAASRSGPRAARPVAESAGAYSEARTLSHEPRNQARVCSGPLT